MSKSRDRRPRAAGPPPAHPELEEVWNVLDRVENDAPGPSAADTEVAWGALRSRLESAGSFPADGGGASSSPGTRDDVPSSDHLDPHDSVVPIDGHRGRRGDVGRRAGAWPRWGAVAAAAVLALIWAVRPVSYTAGVGERRVVALPDGSTAALNAGSTIRHRRSFAGLSGDAVSRSVRLDGEAFFDVVSADRPFHVRAGRARVEVLGTRFNVRVRDGSSGDVDVEVEEGRVRVGAGRGASDSAGDAVVLSAGEGVRVLGSSAEFERRSVSPERVGVWRAGGMALVDTPLGTVLRELALISGQSVELSREAAGERRVSLYYPALPSLETILSDLATQQGLSIRRTASGWEVF